MAAGLIVTRTSDEEDKHLGDSIRKQVMAKPRVLMVAGGICVLMAFVPGFPVTVFLTLAIFLLVSGALLTPALRDKLMNARNPAVQSLVKRLDTPQQVTATALPQQRPSVPLLLRVPAKLLADNNAQRLTRTLEEVLNEFQLNLGLNLPRIHLHAQTSAADAERWELLAFEVPIAAGALPDDPHVALGDPVRQALRRNAPLFLGAQDTTNLLTRASADVPDIVKEVLRALPLQRVSEVLRRLVSEGISIRNLRDILEAVAEIAQRDKDVHALTEFTRVALRRQVSHMVAPQGRLGAVMLQPQVEEMLRQSVRVNGGVSQLALDPEAARRLSDAIVDSVRRHQPAALVTAIDVRWHVRKLIETECFDLPVLSYHELMPTLKLDVVDRVALPGVPMLSAT
jgi:type III secretion protein V